jgi:hypothetical protein
MHTRFWWEGREEIDYLEDLGVDGRMALWWIFRKWDGEAGTVLIWVRLGTCEGLL